jgi:alpha-L-fucosidase
MMDFNRRSVLAGMAALGAARGAVAQSPMGLATGPVQPNWPSLVNAYRYPDWFRDAKLGHRLRAPMRP